MERDSKSRLIQKCSSHTNFSKGALINIEQGKWRNLVLDLDILVREMNYIFNQTRIWMNILLIVWNLDFLVKWGITAITKLLA